MPRFPREQMNRMYEEAWDAVDPGFRKRVVAHLRETIPPIMAQQIREAIAEHGPHEWIHRMSEFGEHHGLGTTIRNELRRAGLRDDQLPPFDAYYGEGTDVRNWDDYYVQATVEAVEDKS